MAKRFLFLIDNTNPHLTGYFPRSCSLNDVGLDTDASDPDIFRRALDKELTIVSRNDRHFFQLMRDAANRSGVVNCAGDGYGLVNPHEKKINYDDITRRLKYGGHRIDWEDVRHFNLKVSLGATDPIVSTLPRCKIHLAECSDPKICDYNPVFRMLGLDKAST
jgi:hypothetical protein